MGSAPKPPGPSKEERAYQQAQTDALLQNQTLLKKQLSDQEALAPYLYKQAGIAPVYDYRWVDPEGNPSETNQVRSERYISGFQELPKTPEQQAYAQYVQDQLSDAKTARALMPFQLEQQGYRLTKDADGNVTGAEVIQGGAADLQNQYNLSQLKTGQQQQEMNQMLLDRAKKAAAGELPVDPALQRQFDEGRTTLESQLRGSLGTGYASSTPGMQALADFEKKKQETIYAAQHGEISTADQLAMAGQQGALQPRMYDPNAALNSGSSARFLQGIGMNPAGQASMAQAAVGSKFNGASGFGTLSQLYSQGVQQFSNQRQRDYQNTMADYAQRQQQGQTYGSIAGGVIGGVVGSIVPGIGTAAGATLGGALGGYAGRSFA